MSIDPALLSSADFIFYFCAGMLSLCCLFYFYCTKKPQKLRSYIFIFMLLSVFLSSLSEMFRVILDYSDMEVKDTLAIKNILSYVYFFLHMMLAPFCAFHVMLANGRAVNRKAGFYMLFFIPAIAAEVIVGFNFSKDIVFYFDENNQFQRGSLEYVLYIIAACYILLAYIQMVSFGKLFTSAANRALWVFTILGTSGIAVQYFLPEIKAELLAESLFLMGVMMIVENEDSLIDVTTRVYNQRAFVVENDRLISTKHDYTVVTISFTNMRFYNRMLRVVTMDNLKHSIAMWIRSVAGKATVYRIGTNSFALISFESDEKTDAIIKKIESKFNDEYLFNGMHFSFNVLIAKAKIPEEFRRVEAILELADIPNLAETQGVSILQGEQLEFLRHKAEVEAMIKRALERERIEVYYQPIWSSESGKIEWCEALVRLNDTELGIITPDNFVEIAEQTGQISEVGKVVFDQVCKFLYLTEPAKYGLKYVEVNLSSYQLLTDDTATHFASTMQKFGIKPEQINLEITESASFHESEALDRNIQRLRDIGFQFSLDDFGTGYSNLTYVINTEFENIKSDKGLLWDVDNYKSRVVLLETIGMMRSLGMDVVQEGVETKDQLDLVVGAGANKIQGYYFSKPLPADEFINFIDKFNREE